MLTTTPYLRTRRPSPTTVEYIVSTSPHLTLSLRLLILTTLAVRLFIGLSILLLLYARYALLYPTPLLDYPPPFFTEARVHHALTLFLATPLGLLFTRAAAAVPLILLLPLSAAFLYTTFLRIHTTESLLVLRGLGIQTSTSSETYLSSATTRFIPTEKIQDIFINEAFRGFEVRYYLVVVVEGEEDVVVVFPRLLPRRAVVEKVWRGARGCLWEGERGVKKG